MHTTSSDSQSGPRRIDLHCHSLASNRPADAALKVLNCPESYSDPAAIYSQAKTRGMDFVTITDHDSVDGVMTLLDRPDVLTGEELTCFFPEDGCKMHIVIWGITLDDHAELQRRASDIYQVAEYIEDRGLAHAVAHPLYRQNEKLERRHLQRLLLLFKGFECLNGAHSPLHREAFEPLLDGLDEYEIQRLSALHGIRPHWHDPHVKSRTGGSDDHGLLNVGRTWTEFPVTVKNPADLLDCLRSGRCRPGGQAGSSLKLAHTFYAIAVRYYSRQVMPAGASPNLPTILLQTIVGERPAPSRFKALHMAAAGKLRRLGRSLLPPILTDWRTSKTQIPTIRDLFLASAQQRIKEHPELLQILEKGLPPLGEHDPMFSLVSAINRDVFEQIADAIASSIDQASFTGLFSSISSLLAQQFVLLPYYFALFHQNKERRILHRITNLPNPPTADTLKVGLFTDTLDEMNGVSRFIRDMAAQAERTGRSLTIHTSSTAPTLDIPSRKNFVPLFSQPLPYYPEVRVSIPPLLDLLQWADRQQFDVIHVSTPGPMGLCGLLAGQMLRAPVIATYHTDFPAYAEHLTGDHRVAHGVIQYMQWFYQHCERTLARSRGYRASLTHWGLSPDRLGLIPPAVDSERFNPSYAEPGLWSLGIKEPLHLLYAGRISVEKNLPFLAQLFKQLCANRRDVALVLAGDGPYRRKMQDELSQFPAYFLGPQNDEALANLYASADLFLFPSVTDTLGQVVMEAQACGLAVLVSSEGGPKEVVDDGLTGLILPANDQAAWLKAIQSLLNNPDLRLKMSRAASQRMARHSLERTFQTFWSEHLNSITGTTPAPLTEIGSPPSQAPQSKMSQWAQKAKK